MLAHISKDKSFYRAMMALAWPLMLQNLISNSLGMLDTFMVGSLGESALAGVALANSFIMISALVNFGFQSGSMILISQYWGKGDKASINRILGIGFSLSGFVSVLFGLCLAFFPARVFSVMTADPELVRVASEYARVAAFSILLNSLSMMYIAAQRSMGNTRMGLAVLCASLVLNTALNWLLIYGNLGFPKMGVSGAALAILISRFCELALASVYAMRDGRFRLDLRYILRPGVLIFKDFVKYLTPVLINETLWSVGFTVYAVILGHMPNAAAGLAAYTLTQTVERLFAALYIGVGNSASVLVGGPLGAGDTERARTAGFTTLFSALSLGFASGVLLLCASLLFIVPVFYPLMGADPETVETGKIMIAIASASLPFKAFNFCNIVGVLRGGGDARGAMLLDLGAIYLFALPLTALTGVLLRAPFVIVYLSISLEEAAKFIAGLWRFSRNKWLQNVTR